jgi:hypothetical protein
VLHPVCFVGYRRSCTPSLAKTSTVLPLQDAAHNCLAAVVAAAAAHQEEAQAEAAQAALQAELRYRDMCRALGSPCAIWGPGPGEDLPSGRPAASAQKLASWEDRCRRRLRLKHNKRCGGGCGGCGGCGGVLAVRNISGVAVLSCLAMRSRRVNAIAP